MNQAFLAARIVAGSLLIAAIVMVSVGIFVTLSGALPATLGGPMALFWVWVVVAIAGTGGWYILWQRAKALAESPAARRETGRLTALRLLQRLVIAWSLLEMQMVAALAASFLRGTPMLLAPAFAIMALGILLSFPRYEWFAQLDDGEP